jgi:predicted RNA-binding Zn-ribbon protein involved in translation (DUF1610 family)
MDTATDSGVEKVEKAAEVKVEIVVAPVEDNKKEEVIIEKPVDYTQSEPRELGRLKRTLSSKCPDCGKSLQLRAREEKQLLRGEEISSEVDYTYCPNCEFEGEFESRKRKLVFDKTAIKKEDIVIERSPRRRDGNGYQNRARTNGNNGEAGNRSPVRRNGRNTRSV